ncbi:hypothetical protein GOP47_0008463 [Adiantum capillus-veneris]|uniref:Uncharacterized protein n=1 Tax=Adiantum capillus-veneris TaxID=13818 RepID=A0A9D4UZC7_ADICA|nr:hypothetical protein GOP47_0008463 [Adiantum capillus-veneris]
MCLFVELLVSASREEQHVVLLKHFESVHFGSEATKSPQYTSWNKNTVCFDAAKMALCDNSKHILQPQLGTTSITGLHVNEGEGAEMNRMSLYEQLTVSSQRFAQLSDHCRPSVACSCAEHLMFKANQHSSSSLPLAFLPQSDKVQRFTCPFFGTIEGSGVCESKFNDAARRQPVVINDILLKTIAAATTSGNLDGTAQKRSEKCLGSLPPNGSNESKKEFTPLVSGQGTPCADVMLLVKGAQCLSLGDNSSHSAAMYKEGVLLPWSEACTGSDNKMAVSTFDLRLRALVQNEAHGEQGAKHSGIFGVGHIAQPEDKVMLLEGPIDAQMQNESCSSERRIAAEENDLDTTLWCAAAGASLPGSDSRLCKVPVLPDHDAKGSSRAHEIVLPISDVAVGHSTANVGMDCRTCVVSAMAGSCKCKIAETSFNDIQMKDDTGDPEAGCVTPISPKSVIQRVGQLRFWKARLALIRQQRIFSDQVFELHKLIEVQRLIANVPINEMYFGVGNMITDSDSDGFPCDFVEIEGVNAESSGKEGSTSKEVGSAPLIVREANLKLGDGQSNCPSNKADVKNKVSAWRYSSSVVVPWARPKPVQTGVSLYPPFAPGLQPGPDVGGPFVAAIQEHGTATPNSPRFPVSLPRPPSTTSVQSSYGSEVASAHQQQSVSNHDQSLGCKVTDLSGSRTPNKKHCAHEGAAISVASINHQPDMSLHRRRTACSSSTNSEPQRYGNEVRSSRKDLEVLGYQAGNLQYASMGSDLNTSMARPPYDRCQYSRHNELDGIRAVDMQWEALGVGKGNKTNPSTW